jgi:hypothetical protein
VALRLQRRKRRDAVAEDTGHLEPHFDVRFAGGADASRIDDLIHEAQRPVDTKGVAASRGDVEGAHGVGPSGRAVRIGCRLQRRHRAGHDHITHTEVGGCDRKIDRVSDDGDSRFAGVGGCRPGDVQRVPAWTGRETTTKLGAGRGGGLQARRRIEVFEREGLRRATVRRAFEFRPAPGLALSLESSFALLLQRHQAERGGRIGGDVADRTRGAANRHLAGVHGGRTGRSHRQRVAAESAQPLHDRRARGRSRDHAILLAPWRKPGVEHHRRYWSDKPRHDRPRRDVVRPVGSSEHVRLPL